MTGSGALVGESRASYVSLHISRGRGGTANVEGVTKSLSKGEMLPKSGNGVVRCAPPCIGEKRQQAREAEVVQLNA